MSDAGDAMITFCPKPMSSSSGSASSAALKNASPGMNITTTSGVGWNCSQ